MIRLLENNILSRLLQVNVLVGLVLLVIGILLACMAGFITKKVRKTKKIQTNDKLYLILKAFALLIVMSSLICMIVQ